VEEGCSIFDGIEEHSELLLDVLMAVERNSLQMQMSGDPTACPRTPSPVVTLTGLVGLGLELVGLGLEE
jgi:hypothetical protein